MHLTVMEIANEIYLNYDNTFSNITDELGFRTVCAKYYFKVLSEVSLAYRRKPHDLSMKDMFFSKTTLVTLPQP